MFSKRKFLIFITPLMLVISTASYAANFIFDLGGVLIDTKKGKAAFDIGIFNLISFGGNPTKFFFSYMDEIKPRLATTPVARDEHGNILPQLMCDWMTGTMTGPQIAQKIYSYLDNDLTISNAEYRIINSLTAMIFDHEKQYIATKRLIADGLAFVKDCKAAGHNVYIISNWDGQTIDALEEKFPELFELVDGKVISGVVGLMKPDPAIYRYCLDTFKLDARETVFLDDQLENLISAQDCGIHGIHCKKRSSLFGSSPDYDYVRKQCDAWQAFILS